jgi:hypothetical protein
MTLISWTTKALRLFCVLSLLWSNLCCIHRVGNDCPFAGPCVYNHTSATSHLLAYSCSCYYSCFVCVTVQSGTSALWRRLDVYIQAYRRTQGCTFDVSCFFHETKSSDGFKAHLFIVASPIGWFISYVNTSVSWLKKRLGASTIHFCCVNRMFSLKCRSRYTDVLNLLNLKKK